jgi:hypothetical protein
MKQNIRILWTESRGHWTGQCAIVLDNAPGLGHLLNKPKQNFPMPETSERLQLPSVSRIAISLQPLQERGVALASHVL